MNNNIDKTLTDSFQIDRIIRAYYDLKLAKWNRFSDWDEPEINIAMGADGIDFKSFEKQLKRHSQNICRRVHNDSYIFYPFRELDILKQSPRFGQPAKYRTLSIASMRDSIVQQILYEDVLYRPFEELFRTLDKPTPVSFAYRKGKSAPKAALMVQKYIDQGYHYIFDADLSKYFDTIPHDQLFSKLEQVIGISNSKSLNLTRRFIHTDRVLYGSYKYASVKGRNIGYKTFYWNKPHRTKRVSGVPQGGVLSGMLANLYLHDFDYWVVNVLGKQIDLKYIRYADDFIILLRFPDMLNAVHDEVKKQLSARNLNLNDDKTLKLDVLDKGLDFVGFHFDGQNVSVKPQNIESFKKAISDAIKKPPEKVVKKNNPDITLRWLVRRIKYKIQGYSGYNRCPKCGHGRFAMPRSWMAFFQIVTDVEQLRKLDKWIRQLVYEYVYNAHHVRITRNKLRQMGLKSLVNEKFSIPHLRAKPCLCDIDQKGLWYFTEDLYLNRKFKTLARGCQFHVERVDLAGISVNVSGKHYTIAKVDYENLWEILKAKGSITRVEMESMGIKNTSQIASLLIELPGIKASFKPIKLYLEGYRPAQFLVPSK